MIKYYCDRCKKEINGVKTSWNKVTIVTESDIEDKQHIDILELCSECRSRFHEIERAFWKGYEIEIKEG